jgi:antitoxin ParD1/3/4
MRTETSDPYVTATIRTAVGVQQLLYARSMSVGFRPTEEDLRVIEANRREDEKTSDVIRRALRLLDREAWEERARADMHRLRSEDLSAEPDAWEYDADGNIRITGTSLTVPARPADPA